MTTIHLNLFDKNIKKTIAELPEKMAAHAEEVLIQQAELMRDIAKVRAPVEYGALRDSIRIERGGKGKGWKQVRIRAGGYVVNPRTGRLVDYARYQEEGTRYIAPKYFMLSAYRDVKPTIEGMIRANIVMGVSQ